MEYIRRLQYNTSTRRTPGKFEYIINEQGRRLNSIKFFAGQYRTETITDVKFVSNDMLVVGNRDQKMLYLIRFDTNTQSCKLLDRIFLTFDGKTPMNVTLICVEGTRIYLTFINHLIGVVDIVQQKLVMRGLYSVANPGKCYHGMTIHPDQKNIVYFSSSMVERGLVILDKTTNSIRHVKLAGIEEICLKQARVLGPYIIVSGTMGNISESDLNYTYEGYVGVYRADTLECVYLLHLPNSQMDDLIVDNGFIYFVRQGSEPYGQVFKYSLQDDKLVKEKEYQVGMFPHGIDVRNGWIACTSMKNSSIEFFPA